MEFNYRATDHTPSLTFTPPSPPPPLFSYLPAGHMGKGLTDNGPNSATEMSEFIRREMEKGKVREEIMESVWTQIQKERIREEIIVDEIFRRRFIEADVRRELNIERELALHGGSDIFMGQRGFPAPLLPYEMEGRPLGESFATSLTGRLGMSSEFRPGFGSLGRGLQMGAETNILDDKAQLGNEKQKEKVVLPARPLQDVNVCTLSSAGSAKKQLREEWSCALCKFSASCEQGLNVHLQGRRHKAKEAGLKKKKKKKKVTIGWFTEKTPLVSRSKDAPLVGSKLLRSVQNIAKSTELVSPSQDTNNTKRNYYSSDDSRKVKQDLIVSKKGINDGENSIPEGSSVVGNRAHKKNGLTFWCEMCQIGTDTEKVMKIHRRGKKHYLANKKQLNRFWCDVCQIGTDTENGMEIHKAGNKHHLANKKQLFQFWCDVCQIGTDTENGMEIHKAGNKHHLAHKKKLFRFWCDECQIGTATENVMEKHKAGNKHLSRLQEINQNPGDQSPNPVMLPIKETKANSVNTKNSYKLLKNLSLSSDVCMKKDEAPLQRTKKTQKLKKNSFKFWCDICQIGADTEEVLKNHKYGKKHQAQLQKCNSTTGGGKKLTHSTSVLH